MRRCADARPILDSRLPILYRLSIVDCRLSFAGHRPGSPFLVLYNPSVPSPFLHGLAGAALAPAIRDRRRLFIVLTSLVIAANAPDFDLIPGLLIGDAARFHHGWAHSLGAAALAGGVAVIAAGWLGIARRVRFGMLIAAAYSSHLILDMLSTGKGVYNAVPLYWPLSHQGYILPPAVFPDIVYDPRAAFFFLSLVSWHNVYAVAVELAVAAALFSALEISRALLAKRSGRQAGRSTFLDREPDSPA